MTRKTPILALVYWLPVGFVACLGAGCGPSTTGNQPPVADAGTDYIVPPGAVVTFDGSGSYDPDGDTLTYSWVQTGGTNTVNLGDATFAQPTLAAPATPDFLTFQLTVDDGHGHTDSDTVTIGVSTSAGGVWPFWLETGESPADHIAE